jgi:hypothetical protein
VPPTRDSVSESASEQRSHGSKDRGETTIAGCRDPQHNSKGPARDKGRRRKKRNCERDYQFARQVDLPCPRKLVAPKKPHSYVFGKPAGSPRNDNRARIDPHAERL